MKSRIHSEYKRGRRIVFQNGDCLDFLKSLLKNSVDLTITSPPYCIGKSYDTSKTTDSFRELHKKVIPSVLRVTKPGGRICWQVGYHIGKKSLTPLDFLVHEIFNNFPDIYLRNRIVWTFGHGAHCKKRFDGRHETILWYTKGESNFFDLDKVRVPQKYPGKRYYKGAKKGEYSGNPLGKNPSDVWDIPNVKANHVEKTGHPCQFPTELVRRLIRAMCPSDGVVLDSFPGSGSAAVAAIIEGRRFYGSELDSNFFDIACNRVKSEIAGTLKVRQYSKPTYKPDTKTEVARKPDHFLY